ncbi:MAG: CCA tRNA nucleotidyltransferase [Oligoflexia bacterium]|nr:CCA tRNA nucleotidyltransferase [Oligoflexia bacterium]
MHRIPFLDTNWIPLYIQDVLNTLHANQFDAFIVGGAVRDICLGKSPKDFDIATNATPEAVESLFDYTKPIGKKFGIMMVIIENQSVEVATFRKDGIYEDHRRPNKIKFGSIEEDSERRDFTMNALYFDFQRGEILDFQNGYKDIQDRKIKTVGDSNRRFSEDALRILRAIRFKSQLSKYNFQIDQDIIQSIKNNIHTLSKVSIERISDEFFKTIESDTFLNGILDLEQMGIWREIFSTNQISVSNKQSPKLKELDQKLFLIQILDKNFQLEKLKIKKEWKKNINLLSNQFQLAQKYSELSLAQKKYFLREKFINEILIICDYLSLETEAIKKDKQRWSQKDLFPQLFFTQKEIIDVFKPELSKVSDSYKKLEIACLENKILSKEDAHKFLYRLFTLESSKK